MADATQEIISLNQKLLESIIHADWKTYETLCDSTISCFEAEARGELVIGMAFHKFYFDLASGPVKKTVTMTNPHVRLLGADGAVITYVRLTQSLDASGNPQTAKAEETRVWQRIAGHWKHVHFHRSANN